MIFVLLMSLELGRILSDRKGKCRLCNRKRQESLLLAVEEVHTRKQTKSLEGPDLQVCVCARWY